MTTTPTWLAYAEKQIGIREIRGSRHEPRILAMAKRASAWLGISVKDDETPWCGTFVADCMQAAGYKPPRGFIGVRAKAWASWGNDVGLAATRPWRGSIAVFGREGGGHVGFVVGVYAGGDLAILGGNQADAVNIRRFPRKRLIALRWPPRTPPGETVAWATAGTMTTGEA